MTTITSCRTSEKELIKEVAGSRLDERDAVKYNHAGKEVIRLLDLLPRRDADILKRRYGINHNAKKKTLKEISETYKISPTAVRTAEHYAMKRLKKAFNAFPWDFY